MKNRLVGATKGHALLKKKADALTLRFRRALSHRVLDGFVRDHFGQPGSALTDILCSCATFACRQICKEIMERKANMVRHGFWLQHTSS
jgi:hypothetical protein